MDRFLVFIKQHWLLTTIVVIIILSAILMTISGIFIKNYARHGDERKVPYIIGISVDDAAAKLSECGLSYEIIGTEYNDSVPKGAVSYQYPEAESNVKGGRSIKIIVNAMTDRMVPIPDNILNFSLRMGHSSLDMIGVNVDDTIYKLVDYEDLILAVIQEGDTLQPGDLVPVGSSVTLCVGTKDISKIPADTVSTYNADSLDYSIEDSIMLSLQEEVIY